MGRSRGASYANTGIRPVPVFLWAISSVWSELAPHKRLGLGSNPRWPTILSIADDGKTDTGRKLAKPIHALYEKRNMTSALSEGHHRME